MFEHPNIRTLDLLCFDVIATSLSILYTHSSKLLVLRFSERAKRSFGPAVCYLCPRAHEDQWRKPCTIMMEMTQD